MSLAAGDLVGTIAHANRARALVDEGDHLRQGAVSALLGLAHWTLGDLPTARARYAEAVACLVAAGYLPDVLGCSLTLGDIQIALGRLGDAERTYETGLLLAREQVGLRGTADMHVGLSEVLLERGDLDGARRELDASRDLGEHLGLPQHRYRWRVARARLLLAHGDPAGALDLLDEAQRVYDTDFSPAVRPIAALRARVLLAQGDLAATERWAADRGLGADDELRYVREFEHITLARVLLARGAAERSLGPAVELLDRLLAAADAGQREGSAIELLVLLALAHEASGDRRAATAALEQALVRAAPEGAVRVFVDAGPAVTSLLRTTSLTGPAREHADRVLAATAPGSAPASAPVRSGAGLVDPLSSRELDVLRLLRSDLSGPDIARELIVSLNTVRTHTKNIYAKLGVTNRRAAVRRAAELGL
jgi:LuxR family maltose regulon positive regulatory protein